MHIKFLMGCLIITAAVTFGVLFWTELATSQKYLTTAPAEIQSSSNVEVEVVPVTPVSQPKTWVKLEAELSNIDLSGLDEGLEELQIQADQI